MDIPKTANVRRWRGNTAIARFVGATVIVLTVVVLLSMDEARPDAKHGELWIDTAREGELLREIRATGALIPKENRWISAEVAGTVQEILVEPGAVVEADTVIMRLSNPLILADLDKASANQIGIDADIVVEIAELDLKLAEQKAALARAESVARLSATRAEAQAKAELAGAVSRMERRQSEIAAEQDAMMVKVERDRLDAMRRSYSAQVRGVRARGRQSSGDLALARRAVSSLEVRASIAGILQRIEVEPGSQVEIGTSLARVANQDRLIARLQVPEIQANDIRLGLFVSVDLGDTVAKGTIARVDPSVKDGRVAIDVEFEDSLPKSARPDLSVDGRILLEKLTKTLSIPRPSSAAPNSIGSLFVLRSDRLAERVRVRYGSASHDRIEVREGLRPGDRVVLSDVDRWANDDALNIE